MLVKLVKCYQHTLRLVRQKSDPPKNKATLQVVALTIADYRSGLARGQQKGVVGAVVGAIADDFSDVVDPVGYVEFPS